MPQKPRTMQVQEITLFPVEDTLSYSQRDFLIGLIEAAQAAGFYLNQVTVPDDTRPSGFINIAPRTTEHLFQLLQTHPNFHVPVRFMEMSTGAMEYVWILFGVQGIPDGSDMLRDYTVGWNADNEEMWEAVDEWELFIETYISECVKAEQAEQAD